MTIIICDFQCGKEILDSLYKCNVRDSDNGSSHNNAGSAHICREALGWPAWNSGSEEQHWFPTLGEIAY